jgi:eukaryotic-like serine/threonine-protein kinase
MAEYSAGDVIGDAYRLDTQLGEGGMGAVWAATHLSSGRTAALKLVKASRHSAETRRRLLREARVSTTINHPNIVRVFSVFELADGKPVIVMERLVGENLREKLDRELSLGVEEAASALLPVISAVGTAHAYGVIHRDLKPENVFLALERGLIRTCVLDFGVAKLTASEGITAASAALTDTGAVVGTPMYMAPEQIMGEVVDHRADIWALGVILYEALSGGRPIDGEGFGQIFKNLMTSAIAPLRMIAPALPPSLTELVDRMLARDRNDRPLDLRSVYEALEPFAQAPSLRFGGAAPSRS